MPSDSMPTAMGFRELKWVASRVWWSLRAAGGYEDCLRRKTGASIKRRWGGTGAAISDKLCSGASSAGGSRRALVRGDDVGVSATRYVVAKMLSRSDSCGRSVDDFHSALLSGPVGAVLERPVCASDFGGVTASWAGA
jgi:hypothetical protein